MAKGVTATVQFCGAGGTSLAARQVGIVVEAAINHSQIAIKSHKANHPELGTLHIRQEIEEVDPNTLPNSDFLLTSPCCTNHSPAKGQKRYHQFDLWGEIVYNPLAEKSRNTMEDVVRFAEAKKEAGHPYKMIVVENVVEVIKWRKYASWLDSLITLGYQHQTLFLNSQFFGVPQSRNRVYLVFWLDALPAPDLDYHPVAYCQSCHLTVKSVQSFKRVRWGSYGKQYTYRCPACGRLVTPDAVPASTVINTSDLGRPIGTRLSPKIIADIARGLQRYQGQPFLYGYYKNPVYCLLNEPIGTITTVDRWALITPEKSLERSYHRMITVEEVRACMGFPQDYQICGTKKEQVWQLGNAVCPGVMAFLLKRCGVVLSPQLEEAA